MWLSYLHQYILALISFKEAIPQLAVGSSGTGLGDLPYLWRGGWRFNSQRTNSKRIWNDSGMPIHVFTVHPPCFRVKLATVCGEPGLLARMGKWDSFKWPLPKAKLIPCLPRDIVPNRGKPVNKQNSLVKKEINSINLNMIRLIDRKSLLATL